jgi:1-acyl-sn-glycerol-3-phosphate acyltransferase
LPSLKHRIVEALILLYVRATVKLDADEAVKIPAQGPLIVVCNHINFVEAPVLFAVTRPRPVAALAKVETWNNPIMALIFEVFNGIPIHRGEADMTALRACVAALKEGKILGVAPEGTRNKNGKMLIGKPGIAALGVMSNSPIMPAAFWGEENYWPNLKRLRRTTVHMRVGEPFRFKREAAGREARQPATDELMYRIARLLPPEYRGVYENLDLATTEYLDFDV